MPLLFLILFFDKNIKNVFITAFYAVPPTAVKIAWNNISSGFAAYAAFCGAIKRFHRFIRN